ncbi:MAG: NAD(P)-dependent dehydrogenase (short-subunit alcohol dehydrogenase family) [Phycisphaerales bacterium]|jgi:NAD(P)-dependent dehydrogenase (short-subunit alcohol dehydrogenase family)
MANILITGANRGLGLEMVKQSLAAGHTVTATAREPATATDLNDTEAHVLPLDVTDPTSVEALAMAVGEDSIDILINNAGAFFERETPDMFELTPEQLMDTYRVNAVGPWMVTRALAAKVARSDRKLIVQISSMMGSCAMAMESKAGGHLAYRSSKSALNMLNVLMAGALAEREITTVAMHPGWVQMDMGGAEATLEIPDAVGRILRTVHGIKPGQSGAFVDLDGKTMPW